MKHTDINYTVRESPRAKRVILKVGSHGLEVVVPRRFGRRKLPGILESNRQWIEKNYSWLGIPLLWSLLNAST